MIVRVPGVSRWGLRIACSFQASPAATRPARTNSVLGALGLSGGALGRAGRAVTDGNGFLFVDHVGAICPSGFLPLVAGNVRGDDLVAVYRDHPVFRALRDPDALGGRCGRCDVRDRCGGSRARAFASAGDMLAEDPGCAYEPSRIRCVSA